MNAVADLPVVPGSTIGIVANPMSGRDIRRLVAQASVFADAGAAARRLLVHQPAPTLQEVR